MRLPVLAGCLALTPSAFATTLYSSFGSGDSYDSGNGYTLAGSSSILGASAIGASFVAGGAPGDKFTLSSVELAIGHVLGEYTFSINAAQDATGLPGASMDTFSGVISTEFPSSSAIQSFAASGSFELQAGQTYWISLISAPDAWDAWYWNDQGLGGDLAISTDDAATWSQFNSILPAFRINGDLVTTNVPDSPSALSLLLLSGTGLLAVRRRF